MNRDQKSFFGFGASKVIAAAVGRKRKFVVRTRYLTNHSKIGRKGIDPSIVTERGVFLH